MQILDYFQKCEPLILGIFLVMIIHYIAINTKAANDEDESSNADSFLSHKDSWI